MGLEVVAQLIEDDRLVPPGGTTGQVLKKQSDADGDTVWGIAAGSVATDAIWVAAGDLAVGTGTSAASRLAKGSALQVLRVNAGATALEWAAVSGTGTVTSITLTQPAAGLTITGSGSAITSTGTPTFALANDLAALEALSGTNTIYYRSATDTWTAVTIGSSLSFATGTLNLSSTPALGTPASGALTNCTGLPITTGVSGLGSNVSTFLTTPTISNFLLAVTGESTVWNSLATAANAAAGATILGLGTGNAVTFDSLTTTTSAAIGATLSLTAIGGTTISLSSDLTISGGNVSLPSLTISAQASDLNLNSHKITNLTDPSGAQDAATKNYVDSVANGLLPKQSCRVATTANITLSGEQTIDGVTTSASRVLVKNQSTASQNGIYTSAAGAWSRSADADVATELWGAYVYIESGTTNAGTLWANTNTTLPTLGSTSLTFGQIGGPGSVTAGTGITVSANQVNITATGVSATTYGSASTVSVITVNAQGQITSANSTAISILSTAISDAASAATASVVAKRDANGNCSFVNVLEGYTTTATAAGTTTLTVASTYQQFFTGSTTQTVVLPVASTLALGQSWCITNSSSGVVTVNSSGSNAVVAMVANTTVVVTCILTSGTSAASWSVSYVGFATVTGTGANVLANGPTLVTPALGVPVSGTLTSCTGLPISTGVSGLGTNVGAQLGSAADGSVATAIGFRAVPQQSKSAAYTTVMADGGYHIFHPSSDANARTFTIDSNANVAYPIGTTISFINDSANAVTIAITSDTLVLAGTGSTGSRTLAQYGMATAIKVSSTRWYINGTNLT